MDSYSDTARSRLNRILKDLADKAEERSVEEEDALKLSQAENDAMPPPTTPSKKTGRAPRKRKRKETSSEEYADTARPTYILKLFDRSVDMAQFRNRSSMYVMCRAWTQNKPHTTYELGNKTEQDMDSSDFEMQTEESQYVYNLPPPIKIDPDESFETNVPKQQTKKDQTKIKQAANKDLDGIINTHPNIITLKTENIARWQKIRLSMRDASLKQQERYITSLLQLKSLFTQP